MISVLLPASLAREAGTSTLTVTEPVCTVGDLVGIIDRAVPGFRDRLDDALFNFAVNDELLLHQVQQRALADGDRVELVPTISGG